jgi:hypothetical protein
MSTFLRAFEFDNLFADDGPAQRTAPAFEIRGAGQKHPRHMPGHPKPIQPEFSGAEKSEPYRRASAGNHARNALSPFLSPFSPAQIDKKAYFSNSWLL